MKAKEIHRYVQKYLETTNCRIIEKSPGHFTVKLSPEADRVLTGRTYYWSFVDRTGAEPETMSFVFITDREAYNKARNATDAAAGAGAAGAGMDAAAGAALVRSYGHVNTSLLGAGRIPEEELYFGSRRLNQLFEAAQEGGSYVCLFQEPEDRPASPFASTAYTPWLGLNIKVEFLCDRKREEMHSLGVSLATGHCLETFHERLIRLKMTPKLPPNIHLAPPGLTLHKAASLAEAVIERKLRAYSYDWAVEATARFDQEMTIMRHYYEPLLKSCDDEERRGTLNEQFVNRQAELEWQYRPRVHVSVMNCGIFHLAGID